MSVGPSFLDIQQQCVWIIVFLLELWVTVIVQGGWRRKQCYSEEAEGFKTLVSHCSSDTEKPLNIERMCAGQTGKDGWWHHRWQSFIMWEYSVSHFPDSLCPNQLLKATKVLHMAFIPCLHNFKCIKKVLHKQFYLSFCF